MSRILAAFGAAVLCLATLAPAAAQAQAQEPRRTILVLDGSGSMWGQIEGEAKITIAQRVVRDLLPKIPEGTELGLTVYGHRRKGDCSDIETVVAPGSDTRGAVLKAVEAIKPKGKTPLSAAVLAAAEALKYQEDPATVILVSDGRETCERDPCEVGRRLEETGVGFTAHVIGFDVADPGDRAQLSCLAEETGGRFLTASNADELAEALTEISTAPAPQPEPVPEPEPARTDVTFLATDGDGGPVLRRGLVWSLSDSEGNAIVEDMTAADLRMALAPGRYRVEVLRTEDEQTIGREVEIAEGAPRTVALALEDLTPDATLEAPSGAVAGSTVTVAWTGPDGNSDYVSVAAPDAPPHAHENYTFTREGSPLPLVMPIEPGDYEIRYYLSDGRKVLARRPVTVTAVQAGIDAPAEAEAGATVTVEWTGPDYPNDYVAVARPGARGHEYANYTYTREGSPLRLLMPAEPGDYEVRYVARQDTAVLASQPITVTGVQASLDAPAEAEAGATVTVEWTGPDYDNDMVSVARPDDPEHKHVNYTFTRKGNPLPLLMPAEPGSYEIRYVQNQDRTVLARRPVTVTGVTARVSAPGEAEAGALVAVDWSGPDYDNDFISVARPDDPGHKSENHVFTRNGAPASLLMPPEPGQYEIRYVQHQDRTVLARQPVTVTAVTASLDAPAEAVAGSTVAVRWTGPDYANDIVSVAKPGEPGHKHLNRAFTRDGSPATLAMPPEPGQYEIRYVQNQGRKILASQPVTVTAVTAEVAAPAEAAAGTTVQVQWSGPDYASDFIAVAEPGDPGQKHVTHVFTREGSPAALAMPARPGNYEVRYVQRQGNTVLARQPVTVTEVQASLDAAASGAPGTRLRVDWTGPAGPRDLIAIARPGDPDGRVAASTRASEGSPLMVRLPDQPGAWELRYLLQGKRAVARRPVQVE